jgi:hypothetical protein
MTETMKVVVLGPNLRTNGAEQFHVHAHGCSDIKKNYGPGKKLGSDDLGWVINVGSRKDIVCDIYADIMEENGETEDDWKAWDDLRVFPCVHGLPEEA